MLLDECLNFRVDGFLKHLPRALSNDLIQWARFIELLPEREHFGIRRLGYWRSSSSCFSLFRGVSLCPRWVADVW